MLRFQARNDIIDSKDQVFTREANIHDAGTALAKRAAVFPLIFPIGITHHNMPQFRQQDFPQVKYWDEGTFKEWFEVNGRSMGQKGRDHLGIKLYFLEDEEGLLLNKTRITNLREFTKGLFMKIRDNLPSALVKSWSHADFEYQQIFYAELRHYFAELGYCANNWKARQFISIFYSDWKRERPTKGKKKAESDDEATTSTSNSAPHSNISHSEESHKTAKVIPTKRPTVEDNLPQAGPSKRPKALFKVADPL
jgi:hypothetical protein